MQLILILLVTLFASFTHTLVGFGSALVTMPILAKLLGVQVAAPLAALIVPTIEFILFVRYREAFNLRVVWRLIASAMVGIPLGVWSLRQVNERIILTILGVVLIVYALYGFLKLKLPELEHSSWAYGFGFIAGLLNGAYNTSGPPIIIYGNCRRWSPDEFKANLQGFFTVTGLWVIVNHAFNGNLTPFVWQHYLLSWIAIALGIWLGLKLDQYIAQATFRKIVLAMLIILGAMMLL
ncbi:MAG: hypothetical protein A2Z14_13020 [Chloroflexi bacterium RBG_16_48_8]|nr:MAG: hypothetical protein A2Z14_13020 [Chloroflexi bacterium RBG_16_48_8]